MSRKLMAVLISSALVFANVSTGAWSATDTPNVTEYKATQTTDGARNLAPLPAGGVAGIKQAQGLEGSPLLGLGLVAAIVVIAWVLIDNQGDDDSTPSTN